LDEDEVAVVIHWYEQKPGVFYAEKSLPGNKCIPASMPVGTTVLVYTVLPTTGHK
jgi:hypothetical protein